MKLRITLRPEGSPVKFTGTVIQASYDGRRITVEFDGPMVHRELFAFGPTQMLSDMFDKDGNPTEDTRAAVKSIMWNVV